MSRLGWSLDAPASARNLDRVRECFSADWPAAERLLTTLAPELSDPDAALNRLERYLSSPHAREQVPRLLEYDGRALRDVVLLVDASEFFADVLASDPEALHAVAGAGRDPPTRDELLFDLASRLTLCRDDAPALHEIRRFRRRQILRVAADDVIRESPLERVTRDLSHVAEAVLEAGLGRALRTLEAKHGTPRDGEGRTPSRCCVLAFGKLGGAELNYSSDLDLMLIYSDEGRTDGRRPVENSEFYASVATELIRLAAKPTEGGAAYRIDMRLRPEGNTGPLARSLAATLRYYDMMGRTWERQALIKVRPVAGDESLGAEFVSGVEDWVYRRYLSFAEINEIKAVKRRIERHTHRRGEELSDVKTGRGGIRDIEFVIQFLQLLNGGDWTALRCNSTLDALRALGSEGCLADHEVLALDEGYRFLRKVEHRLQTLFDWQTHTLPREEAERRKLAMRAGYREASPPPSRPSAEGHTRPQRPSAIDEPTGPTLDVRGLLVDPLDRFTHDLGEFARRNRVILEHLLHDTFADEGGPGEPESDLILAPEPDAAARSAALGRYGFRDPEKAYEALTALGREGVRFLSQRRCRHFLASIAPALLRAVAKTPDPDLTLDILERVAASLGAKGLLWESFAFAPASLTLFVELCGSASFLSQILINNPGMIDELIDSLQLNATRTLAELERELEELCRGVERPEVLGPILHSFQDKEWLRVGVGDLLGSLPIRATTRALSDVAEAMLRVVGRRECRRLAAGRPAPPYAVVGLGKFGGREMSYFSDLDLVIVYGPAAGGSEAGDLEFVTRLGQAIIKTFYDPGPLGRLYTVDMRLRPMGQGNTLAIPLAQLEAYGRSGAQLWERQTFSRARIVGGEGFEGDEVVRVLSGMLTHGLTPCRLADEVRDMRRRIEKPAGPRDLKRSPGGLIDVEFAVQLLTLRHADEHHDLPVANTCEALDLLRDLGLLAATHYSALSEGYAFLRLAEARLRLLHNRVVREYPAEGPELAQFARRLGESSPECLLGTLKGHVEAIRRASDEVYEAVRRS